MRPTYVLKEPILETAHRVSVEKDLAKVTEEPYIRSKELYVYPKEPYIRTKGPNNHSYTPHGRTQYMIQNSPVHTQKSTTYA